jgi:hypothetical protein
VAIRCLDYTSRHLRPTDYFFKSRTRVIEAPSRANAWREQWVLCGVHHASGRGFPRTGPCNGPVDEVEELLHKSQESLKKSVAANRKLKAVMTKVNKVVGRRKSVKRKVKR